MDKKPYFGAGQFLHYAMWPGWLFIFFFLECLETWYIWIKLQRFIIARYALVPSCPDTLISYVVTQRMRQVHPGGRPTQWAIDSITLELIRWLDNSTIWSTASLALNTIVSIILKKPNRHLSKMFIDNSSCFFYLHIKFTKLKVRGKARRKVSLAIEECFILFGHCFN